MVQQLINILKYFKIYPESGYGEIIIRIRDDKIFLAETHTQAKLID